MSKYYIPKLDVSELTMDEFYALAAIIKVLTGRDFYLQIGGKHNLDIKVKERK